MQETVRPGRRSGLGPTALWISLVSGAPTVSPVQVEGPMSAGERANPSATTAPSRSESPGTIAGSAHCPQKAHLGVGKVHRLHDPHVLERLGCVLRVATAAMAKEELPHDLGHLLSRLAELEVTIRPRRRRAPDKR